MSRVLVLVFIILLALASLGGYLFLDKKIKSGELQLDNGQKQYDNGQRMIREGKAKLARGKRKLARAQNTYNTVSYIPIVAVAKILPITGAVIGSAKSQIAAGGMKVAQGESAVMSGEARLAAGKIELAQGWKRLSIAKGIRDACGVGVALFVSLAIALGLYWRRELAKIFRR